MFYADLWGEGTLEERELRVPGLLLIQCAGGPDA